LRCGMKRHLMGAAVASGGWLPAAGLPDAKAAAGCAQSKESKGLVMGAVGVRIGGRWKGVGDVGKVGWELSWGWGGLGWGFL
jgi:hypothetical protein